MALTSRGIDGGVDINVLVDTTGSGDAEVVKLAIGTLGSSTLVPGDGTNGMVVQIKDGADVTEGAKADAAAANPSATASVVAILKGIWTAIRDQIYPASSTPLIAGSGNVANATATATLTGVALKTMYLTGFTITAGGATAAAVVQVTVSGLLGGSRIYIFGVPAGAGVPATPLNVHFNPPLPASAVNTSIAVSVPALGTGNTNAAVVAQGYYI